MVYEKCIYYYIDNECMSRNKLLNGYPQFFRFIYIWFKYVFFYINEFLIQFEWRYWFYLILKLYVSFIIEGTMNLNVSLFIRWVKLFRYKYIFVVFEHWVHKIAYIDCNIKKLWYKKANQVVVLWNGS